jgi:putative hydrolase of the HAD superfamily
VVDGASGRVSRVLEAVLFDWGHTLMDWVPDDELLEAGHRAGLAAIGASADLAPALTERYRNEEKLSDWEVPEEVEYPALARTMLADVGVHVDDTELERFLLAEHAAWAPARRLAGTTHALLDAIRERGLKTGIVSNAFDPGWILMRDLTEMGLAERLDVAVFSSDVGLRKPHPTIFQRALDELGVQPERALFVGDRLRQDVGGAHALGMRTVQAMWFRVEEDVDGIEPDFRAFTQFDVLNVVRRFTGELPH